MEAHNVAGISIGEYNFITLTKDGETIPPELIHSGPLDHRTSQVFELIKFLLPFFVISLGIICLAGIILVCIKHREYIFMICINDIILNHY